LRPASRTVIPPLLLVCERRRAAIDSLLLNQRRPSGPCRRTPLRPTCGRGRRRLLIEPLPRAFPPDIPQICQSQTSACKATVPPLARAPGATAGAVYRSGRLGYNAGISGQPSACRARVTSTSTAMDSLEAIPGSVCAPAGFLAGTAAAGLKESGDP